VKQLVHTPAKKGGPRHCCNRAEAKNRECNDFADHSRSILNMTKAQNKYRATMKRLRPRSWNFNRPTSIDSNKVTLLQISVALLIVQCRFADSNVYSDGMRFNNTSDVVRRKCAVVNVMCGGLPSLVLTAQRPSLFEGGIHTSAVSDH
jgi:hypothetical protein